MHTGLVESENEENSNSAVRVRESASFDDSTRPEKKQSDRIAIDAIHLVTLGGPRGDSVKRFRGTCVRSWLSRMLERYLPPRGTIRARIKARGITGSSWN